MEENGLLEKETKIEEEVLDAYSETVVRVAEALKPTVVHIVASAGASGQSRFRRRGRLRDRAPDSLSPRTVLS